MLTHLSAPRSNVTAQFTFFLVLADLIHHANELGWTPLFRRGLLQMCIIGD